MAEEVEGVEGVEVVEVVRQLVPPALPPALPLALPPALPPALLHGLQLDVQPQHSSLNHNSVITKRKKKNDTEK